MSKFHYNEKEEQFYFPDEKMTFQEYFNQQKQLETQGLKENVFYQNEIKYYISNNSKIIKFVDFGKTHDIFICNKEQVLFLLEKFGFDKYVILKDGIEIEHIKKSLDFDTIKKVENYLKKEDFEKANKAIIDPIIPLKDLSLLYEKYQKFSILSQNFQLTKEREEFFEKLKNLIENNNLVYISGPKYIGKTTSLLYYLKKNVVRHFYINLSYIKKLFDSKNKSELILAISKELYCCLDFEEVKHVYSYLNEKQYSSIMELVFDLLSYLASKFSSKEIYVVLDQYKEKLDVNNSYVKKIHNMLKKIENLSIIICNSLNEKDFRKSLELYLKDPSAFFINYLFISKLVSISKNEIDILKKEEKQLLLKCGNLFQYYYEIIENRNELSIKDISNKIVNEIIEDIKGYYNNNNTKEIICKIREIYDNINQPISYDQLYNLSKSFPFKYFYFSVDSNNSFAISDIKSSSTIKIDYCAPIVMDCIWDILYECKGLDKEDKNNFNAQKSSIALKENFEEYLWTSRFNYSYEECKIIKKLSIDSIIKIKDKNEKEKYEAMINYLNDKNDSILIVQNECYAPYFDTAILKCINKQQKIYELYLFQETIYKAADERLCRILLNTEKYYLKFLFFENLNIYIKEVYFSYVFKGEKPDYTSINYCEENQINYIKYFESERKLIISNIDNKIKSVFQYLKYPKDKSNFIIDLPILDFDFSNTPKEEADKEFDKLHNYLQNKREMRKKTISKIDKKINEAMNFDNLTFRKNNYTELFLDEELMGKERVVGVSYQIDKETTKIINDLNFKEIEKENLFDFVKNFGTNIDILKITKIDNLTLGWIPSFRSAILIVNRKKNKFYYDIQKKISYNLLNKEEEPNLDLKSKFFLLIFANKNMIA